MCWGAPAAQPLDPEARQGSLSFLSLQELCGGVHMGMQGHVQCEQCVYRCESLTFVWVKVTGVHECRCKGELHCILWCVGCKCNCV